MVVANDPSGTGKLEANEAEDSEGADGDGDVEKFLKYFLKRKQQDSLTMNVCRSCWVDGHRKGKIGKV